MSNTYQRNIEEDFDDDGADAMEYEPSERSMDQKSLYEDIPEPYQYENTNETLEGSKSMFPMTSSFGNNPNTIPSGIQYYGHHTDMSQNISSSFLNLSDSVSQKDTTSRVYYEQKSIETAANNESLNKIDNKDDIQELKQQLVELKRTLSIKEQDLMYTKQRNEKLNNQLTTYKTTDTPQSFNSEFNTKLNVLSEENMILKNKNQDYETEINNMRQYMDEVWEGKGNDHLATLLKAERQEKQKLIRDK